MPAGEVQFKPRTEILSFEEIERFVRQLSRLGISTLRLTGGEPLVRRTCRTWLDGWHAYRGSTRWPSPPTDCCLPNRPSRSRTQGSSGWTPVSTPAQETFRDLTRRDGLETVLAGIFAARRAGFDHIKLNAVAIRGVTEADIVPLAQFAREHAFELRFIEFMPLDAEGK